MTTFPHPHRVPCRHDLSSFIFVVKNVFIYVFTDNMAIIISETKNKQRQNGSPQLLSPPPLSNIHSSAVINFNSLMYVLPYLSPNQSVSIQIYSSINIYMYVCIGVRILFCNNRILLCMLQYAFHMDTHISNYI